MLRLLSRRVPSPTEQQVFLSLAAEASDLGRVLGRSNRVRLDRGETVDLGLEVEHHFLVMGLKAGVKQCVRGSQDLLDSLERLNGMLAASVGKQDANRRTELALSILRAMVICELLQSESRARYAKHAPLAELAETTCAGLARGCLRALRGELPSECRWAFPCFARALKRTAKESKEAAMGGASDVFATDATEAFDTYRKR